MFKSLSRAVAIVNVVAGGYRAAYKIDSFKEPNRPVLPKYINAFCRELAKALDIELIQLNEIPQHHALWASNHISWVDIAAVGTSCPAFCLSRADVADWPVIGRLMTAAGTLYIERGSGDSASVKDQIAQFLQTGISVMFFPEATTTDGRQIKKIHSKLFQAAIDVNVPVQPVLLTYVDYDGKLDDVIPFVGDISFKSHLLKVLAHRPSRLYIKALEPLYPHDYADKEALTEEVKKRMDAGLKAMHAQVLKH